MTSKKNMLLCILDGVGVGENNNENALYLADTPILDKLYSNYPHSQLRCDGKYVGIPKGQMGNSEVGHIAIGTGRVIEQSLIKITNDFQSKQFKLRPNYTKFIEQSINSGAIHLIGLLSDGGIHSHISHALHLCKELNQLGIPVLVHGITDGRDTKIDAAESQIDTFLNQIDALENVHLVTLIGRFYAMDRDNRWDRTEQAWDLYTKGLGEQFTSAQESLKSAYSHDLSDEHITSSIIKSSIKIKTVIQDNDSVLLFNFRGDRMRQLTRCFLNSPEVEFNCNTPKLKSLAIMTEYDTKFRNQCHIIYPPETGKNSLGEVISKVGLKQLRIAETEKYAHVTFFFNNGREKPFKLEDRILIPSPRDVSTYDQKPEMSLPELSKKLVKIIIEKEYNFIALNIANADMVGHTGRMDAAIKAVEAIDTALAKITNAIEETDGEMLIIADHGNIESMGESGSRSTTHTSNPVPCIYYGKRKLSLKNGSLTDVAPTVLDFLSIEKPKEMTGETLISNLKE